MIDDLFDIIEASDAASTIADANDAIEAAMSASGLEDLSDLSEITGVDNFDIPSELEGSSLNLPDDDYNVSFGKKVHVEHIGGGLGEAEVDLEKKPGTAHTWIVKKGGKLIAELKSLSESFYVPGIGTCKIT